MNIVAHSIKQACVSSACRMLERWKKKEKKNPKQRSNSCYVNLICSRQSRSGNTLICSMN